MQLTLWKFLKNQWSTVPPVLVEDLTGKTILVTGANTGLGYETAKYFAKMTPGKLIIACRNKAKGNEAVTRTSSTLYSHLVAGLILTLTDRPKEGDRLLKYSAKAAGFE